MVKKTCTSAFSAHAEAGRKVAAVAALIDFFDAWPRLLTGIDFVG